MWFCRAMVLASSGLVSLAGPANADWQLYTRTDGLTENYLYSVCDDSSGRIWFGTRSGVSCYDGESWTTYTVADSIGLVSVRALCEDSSGNMWIGSYGCFACFDGESWTAYTYESGLAAFMVSAIIEDSSGRLWFGSSMQGVSCYDGEEWTNYRREDGLVSSIVRAIQEDSSGNLWFATNRGVSRFDDASWITYTEADGLVSNDVRAIHEDSSGNLWFGTGRGISRFDGTGWVTYTEADGLLDDNVWTIHEDDRGFLWFGTAAGSSRFDGRLWRAYSLGWARDIITDASGYLWFATHNGAYRYDGTEWLTYAETDGLSSRYVHDIIQDSSGDLWFATGDGVTRFNGSSWTIYTEVDGLVDNDVLCALEDSSGKLWFGTFRGMSCYDGSSWTTYTRATGLVSDYVTEMFEDSAGNLWFASYTYAGGASRFDGESWTTYTDADGLPSREVCYITQDSSGNMWFGTDSGACRFDGFSWTTYTEEDGLADNDVASILEDKSGNLWFGTNNGLSRYDGQSWITYTMDDGLPDVRVGEIMEDCLGYLWFSGPGGLSVFDGTSWATYTGVDGLAGNSVICMLEDPSGVLWFGTSYGVSAHWRDLLPPETTLSVKPEPLSSSATQTIAFRAGFKEEGPMKFSFSFDGSPWSEWGVDDSWTGYGLSDGVHQFQVKAQDRALNVDSTAAVCIFEIDATRPLPLILSPSSGQAVRDSVQVEGTADDARFLRFSLQARPSGEESWQLLAESSYPVTDGTLCWWNTARFPDGDYELLLSVTDTLGLTGSALVRVIVDNEAPWAYETTPVLIKAVTGGDVFTSNWEAHLYFPPNGFVQDTEVRIEGLGESAVPDTLVGGATRVLAGYEISWGDSLLAKPATLELSYEGMELHRDAGPGAYPDEGTLAIYVKGSDSQWRRLGGTIDCKDKTIASSVTEPGVYSVFAGGQAAWAGTSLSALTITPRVFSPSGGFASSRAAIGFTLGRAGPVKVKIYNRAGRLVSEVASGERLNAGANLVHWDGRDREGDLVEDGVYLVAVEALGQKQVKPLAVVR